MKIIENYTPSKGLMVIVVLLVADLFLQLYLMSNVMSFEITGNKIKCDVDTLSIVLIYVLTSVVLLFILSEFFIMKKMESLFSIVELKNIRNNASSLPDEDKLEDQLNCKKNKNDENSGEKHLEEILEIEQEEKDIENKPEVKPEPSYKMLSLNLQEEEQTENKDETIEPKVKDSPVFEPEATEADLSESEIIHTITELQGIVEELKSKKESSN